MSATRRVLLPMILALAAVPVLSERAHADFYLGIGCSGCGHPTGGVRTVRGGSGEAFFGRQKSSTQDFQTLGNMFGLTHGMVVMAV